MENCKNCKKVRDEIKNTVDMEKLSKQIMQDFNVEHQKVVRYEEFIEYLKGVCSLRMTFENPNEDLQCCLNFIDTTFDDLLIRIKDLEKINN